MIGSSLSRCCELCVAPLSLSAGVCGRGCTLRRRSFVRVARVACATQITAASRETGETQGFTVTVRAFHPTAFALVHPALLRATRLATDNACSPRAQETGRRVYSTSDPAISAMDKLGVDESLPLSNQATFSLFFDLGAFGVS
jgi:hypothetical protein